jgi:hypothetical protein
MAPDDPVHMVLAAYEAAAASILEAANGLDATEPEPAAKRQRVESIIVTVKGPPVKANQTKWASFAKPTWSTGEIERPTASIGQGSRGARPMGNRGHRG